MKNREKFVKKLNNVKLAKIIIAGECEYCPLYDTCNSNVIANDICIGPIVAWLETEATSDADEMFEKLGYKFESKQASCVVYKNVKYKDKYDIYINIGYDGSFYKEFDCNTPEYLMYITKAEDKAIHKKIEELENGNSYQN